MNKIIKTLALLPLFLKGVEATVMASDPEFREFMSKSIPILRGDNIPDEVVWKIYHHMNRKIYVVDKISEEIVKNTFAADADFVKDVANVWIGLLKRNVNGFTMVINAKSRLFVRLMRAPHLPRKSRCIFGTHVLEYSRDNRLRVFCANALGGLCGTTHQEWSLISEMPKGMGLSPKEIAQVHFQIIYYMDDVDQMAKNISCEALMNMMKSPIFEKDLQMKCQEYINLYGTGGQKNRVFTGDQTVTLSPEEDQKVEAAIELEKSFH